MCDFSVNFLTSADEHRKPKTLVFKMSFVATVLSFLVGALFLKIFNKILAANTSKVPSLVKYPVLNFLYCNYKLLLGSNETRQKNFNEMILNHDKYFQVWFGTVSAIVVTGPEQIKKVLFSPKCSEKFKLLYNFIDTENSLVSGSMLHRWPTSRKFCNASFSPSSFQSMRVKFEKSSADACKFLNTKLLANEFNVLEMMKPISFEIFSEVFLGLSGYEENEKFMDTLTL